LEEIYTVNWKGLARKQTRVYVKGLYSGTAVVYNIKYNTSTQHSTPVSHLVATCFDDPYTPPSGQTYTYLCEVKDFNAVS
jgi:hypothetical protein